MKERYDLPCNIAQTLNIIGDRWTLLIIRDLAFGKTKFNELKQSLTGIATNLLSDRLQMLENVGIVQFRRVSSAASWLFLPYLAWVSFAAALNAAIAHANR